MINKIGAGREVLRRLCDSLGISGPVNKLVVEIQADGSCVVYVKRFLTEDSVDVLINATNSLGGKFQECVKLEVVVKAEAVKDKIATAMFQRAREYAAKREASLR